MRYSFLVILLAILTGGSPVLAQISPCDTPRESPRQHALSVQTAHPEIADTPAALDAACLRPAFTRFAAEITAMRAGETEFVFEYQRWQDGEWKSDRRFSYTVDAWGNQVSEMSEVWDGRWIGEYRLTYSRDPAGLPVESVFERWANGSWSPSSRTAFTYDSDERLIELLSEKIENGTTIPSFRQSISYNSEGTASEKFYEDWQFGSWQFLQRESYTYDDAGNRVQELSQFRQGSEWVNSRLVTYRFDDNGVLLEHVEHEWKDGAWSRTMRFLSEVEPGLVTEIQESWRAGELISAWRMIHKMDLETDRFEVLYSSLNQGVWIDIKRQTGWYIEGSDKTVLTEKQKDGEWVADERRTYRYDEHGDYVGMVHELFDGEVWMNHRRMVRTVRHSVARDESPVASTFALEDVYPNPTSARLTVRFAVDAVQAVRLELIDVLGRRHAVAFDAIAATGSSYTTAIDTGHLAPGVYFLRLSGERGTRTQTVVVAR